MSTAELAKRLRSFNDAIGAEIPTYRDLRRSVDLESPDTLDAALDNESIILRSLRPVLAIKQDAAVLAFQNAADDNVWKSPLAKAAPAITTAARAVGRIEVTNHPFSWIGTGWLVAPDIVVTNRHVAAEFAMRNGERFVFRDGPQKVSLDFLQELENPNTDVVVITQVLHIEESSGPDLAFLRIQTARKVEPIRLARRPAATRTAATIGYPAYDSRIPEPELMMRVYQNAYQKKRIAPGTVVAVDDRDLRHDCTTLGGNSGSVVLDLESGEALGLHYAGTFLTTNTAVRADVVAERLDDVRAGRVSSRRARWSTRTTTADDPPVVASIGAETTLTVTIPLHVTITMGAPIAAHAEFPELAPTAIAVPRSPARPAQISDESSSTGVPVIHPGLTERTGYQPDFLGHPLALPTLTDRGRQVVARLADSSYEVKYHRFSIVMHALRRLALFTAANVDWRKMSRRVDGRAPSRSELTGLLEGQAERWVLDPRIGPEDQIPERFFTSSGTALDKGHLVRRDDVAWGSSFDDMQRGHGDTYHVTNCLPQVARFNTAEAGDNWGDLEDLVQRVTQTDRSCVFSGPALDPEDPYVRGRSDRGPLSIQIPQRFWKVIVVRRASSLAAYGFLLEQDLRDVPPSDAEFVVRPAWRRYLTSIREIESLLFGLVKLDALHAIDAARFDEGLRIADQLEPSSAHVDSMCMNELEARGGVAGALESVGTPATIPVLIDLKDPVWTPPDGVEVTTQLDSVVAADVTNEGLTALGRDPKVRRVEASRDGGVYNCDVSIPYTIGARDRFPALGAIEIDTSSHVIIAVVDTGIDILHECFRDATGASRVIAIWNQKDPTGPSPKASDPRFSQERGTYYDAAAIAGFVATRTVPPGLGRDPSRHGTFVTSIAAGRQCGAFAGGMAQNAKIAVVIPKLSSAPGDPESLGYSSAHVQAFGFLSKLAEIHNLPIVVNVSAGMNAGAHDGMSVLEKGFELFTQYGSLQGRAIVKSAGNEFGFGGHAHLVTVARGLQRVRWTARNLFRERDYFEAWFSQTMDLDFVLIDPSNPAIRSDPVNRETKKVSGMLGGTPFLLELTPKHPDNGDSRLVIDLRAPITPGRWTLEINGKQVSDPRRRGLHIWVERSSARSRHDDIAEAAVEFTGTAGAPNEMTLSIPGTANTVITVGACTKAEPLDLAGFSSHGPTRDGRQKPELVAPGMRINAALAGTDNSVCVDDGTSFAAPHVAGAIALLFSRKHRDGKPLPNAVQIQQTLAATVRSTGDWHPGYGYGVLDVLAFLSSFE